MKLKQLENEIKLLCPEIMELKFGCKIKNSRGDLIIVGKSLDGYYITDWGGMICSDTTIKKENITEILGRDITLPDILKTIHKKYCDYLFVDTQGQFVKKLVDGEYSETGIYFDLGKPLHLQKPEVWEFLSKLILKK